MPIISKNIKNFAAHFTWQFNLVCHERSLNHQFCTVMQSEHTRMSSLGRGELLPKKFGGGVRPAPQNTYPI